MRVWLLSAGGRSRGSGGIATERGRKSERNSRSSTFIREEKRAANQWDGAEGCFELDTLMRRGLVTGLSQSNLGYHGHVERATGFRSRSGPRIQVSSDKGSSTCVCVCVTPVNIASSESG